MDTDTTTSTTPAADPAAILDGATETAEAAPAERHADPRIALLRMQDEIARMIGREIERATTLTAAGGRLPSARCEHIQAVAALASAAAAIRTANALERIADAQEENVNMIR